MTYTQKGYSSGANTPSTLIGNMDTLFTIPSTPAPALESARRVFDRLEAEYVELEAELESQIPDVFADDEARIHQLKRERDSAYMHLLYLEAQSVNRTIEKP